MTDAALVEIPVVDNLIRYKLALRNLLEPVPRLRKHASRLLVEQTQPLVFCKITQ